MKKIEGLQDKIVDLQGKNITDNVYPNGMTKKDILMNSLYMARQVEPAKAIKISAKLLPMLQADKQSGEFEDAEFEMMKEVASLNGAQYPLGLFGQMMQLFEVKDEKDGEKKEEAKPQESDKKV